MQFGKTQKIIADNIFDYLNEKYKVSLEVQQFKITAFGEFEMLGLLVRDHHLDTLVYAKKAEGIIFDLHKIKNKEISIEKVKISDAWVNDKTYAQENESSLTVFSNSFKPKKKSNKALRILLTNIELNQLRYLKTLQSKPIVDFSHIGGHIDLVDVIGLATFVKTDSLSFKDIYGIDYKKLKTDFLYSLSEMNFRNTSLTTQNSNLSFNLKFISPDKGYANFIDAVKLRANILDSDLALSDVNKIYPHFIKEGLFNISSDLEGTLNNLKLDKTSIIAKDYSSILVGDFLLKNSIHNREYFWLSANKANLELKPGALTQLVPEQYHTSLPTEYYGLNQLNYNGDLYVSKTKLVLNGEAVSNLGNIEVNGFVDNLTSENRKIQFKVPSGIVLKNSRFKGLKKITFSGDVKGIVSKDKYNLTTKILLKKLGYKQNTFSNIDVSLVANNKDVKANVISKDPLLSFNGDLSVANDLKGTKTYDVGFMVSKAKLSKLFPKNISFQKNITANGKLNLEQVDDDIKAKGLVNNLHIETASDSLNLNDVTLNFVSEGLRKDIKLTSKELLKLNVEGEFEFADFEKLVVNALYKFIPGTKARNDVKDQTLAFGMEVYPKLIKSITNKVVFTDNIKLSGILDAKGDKGVIYGYTPSLTSQDIKVDSLKIILDNSNKWINSNITAKEFSYKKQVYNDLSLLGKKLNDTLFVRSNFSSNKINNRAVFYLTTNNNKVNLGIENVYLQYLNSIWTNNTQKKNKIHYNYKKGFWNFNGLAFVNGNQELEFNGQIEKDQSKNLRLALKNVNLAEVLPNVDSLKVGGIATGEVFFKEKNTLLRPNGNLVVNKLKINGVSYGLMKTSIKPNEKELGYDISFNMIDNDINNINAQGEIIVDKNDFSESDISLSVSLNKLKLSSLSPLGRDVLSTIRGSAGGQFKVTGKLNNFNSYGDITLNNSGLKFPYLNTNYNLLDRSKIKLTGKTFVFDKIKLTDSKFGTEGFLSGKINYDRYNNWYLNLRMNTENLLVMDTEQEEDSKYFGTGFMKGSATIQGYTSNLSINVTGTTLEGTKFTLPISDIKEIEKNRFIYFKQSKEAEGVVNNKEQVSQGGVSVTLNLDITNDAIGEVVIDQTSGSSLQGRVDGRLLIDIDSYSNIKMFGDLIVDEGLYNFKYGGVVNKPFIVKRGGRVSWNGDPYKADLNIEAVHSVKANPKVLLENLSINRKIDIDLITQVSGELFDSNQEFMIEIPNASSNVTSELDFKLNIDENAKMRQFFSLLVSKSFFDDNNTGNTSNVISNTTSELISNAVTDIFNKSNDKLQINFGYTSGETSDVEDLTIDNQIDIGVATEINDRILINGNLGVPVGAKTQSTVIGEVKIEFLINKDGSLRTSVFNRQNEIQYSQDEQGYTQGLGINYQINFNTLREMLYKLKRKPKKDKK
ncbi:translocation/assembly module TamB domain-containing protein [Wenyingzhuangia sp. IMCC45533]